MNLTETQTVTFDRGAKRGEMLYFMVDSRKEVDETDQENNITSGVALSDLMLPGLYITGMTPNPARPNAGDTVTWTVTVRNYGPGNSPPFSVSPTLIRAQ